MMGNYHNTAITRWGQCTLNPKRGKNKNSAQDVFHNVYNITQNVKKGLCVTFDTNRYRTASADCLELQCVIGEIRS